MINNQQISGDGNFVAMGTTNGGSNGGGFVETYRYQEPNWVSHLPGLDTLKSSDVFGYSLSLSFDGTVMAVGSVKADSTMRPPVRDAGKVDVYARGDGSQWILRGTLFGESKLVRFGESVVLSQDGGILVVGEPAFTWDDSLHAGRCQIFEWNGSEYELIYAIVGQFRKEEMGSSAAVSNDGNIIACGGVKGRWDEIPAAESGVARLWNRSTAQEKSIWPRGKFRQTVDGASFGSTVSLSADGKLLFVGASTWKGSEGNSPGGMHIFDTYW
jgi:hypothetical protein